MGGSPEDMSLKCLLPPWPLEVLTSSLWKSCGASGASEGLAFPWGCLVLRHGSVGDFGNTGVSLWLKPPGTV